MNVDASDRNGLLLPDHDNQSLASGHASIKKVPLQHGVMVSEHGDNHGRIFRSLASLGCPVDERVDRLATHG